MIWRILKIDATKDKKAITRAYREQLSSVNPEEKPEEFKQLRAAYEEALRLADLEEVPVDEKSELDLWVEELTDIYNNFQARIDVDAWRDLLSRDICQGLDTRSQVEEALLVFLLEHYQMTQKVMAYLEEEFTFTDHLDELMEKFPRDFIEYIIVDAARYTEPLPLDMFEPGFDATACDAYALLYQQARRAPLEEAGDLMEQLLESPETHPYGHALILKNAVRQGDFSAIPKLKALKEEWPEDEHLALNLALACKLSDDIEQMKAVCEKILEKNPTSFLARRFMAEALAADGDYKTAIDKMNEILRESDVDTSELYELNEIRTEWNKAYAEQLHEKLLADPDDPSGRFELIWCYLENDDRASADSLIAELPEEQPDAFSYYNLKAVIAEGDRALEEALQYLEKLLEVAEHLQPDGTEKTEKRIGRKPEIMSRIALVYMELDRFAEADAMLDRVLAEYPDHLESLLLLSQIALGIRNNEKAAALADTYIRKGPRSAFAYYMKASACFRMRNDGQAFQLVNAALELDPSDLQSYLLKLRILVRNRANEAADELFAFLEENGITDDPTVNFCKLHKYALSEDEKNAVDLKDYLNLAETIDQTLEAGEIRTPFWAPEFYYHYADLTLEYERRTSGIVTGDVIAILDKGIAVDAYDLECLKYKAWILKRDGQPEKALEIYKQLEDSEDNLFIVKELAELHYQDLAHKAAEALHYYEILIQNGEDTAANHFYAGMCCMRMNRLTEANQHFLKEQEIDPEDIDGFFRQAFVLLKMNRLEEALLPAMKTVELAKERENANTVQFFLPLIRTYRRLGDPDASIQMVKDCARFNPDWDAESMIFSIWVQFGRFAEAEAFAREAMNSGDRERRLEGYSQLAEVLMLQGKEKKLVAHLVYYKKDIDEDRRRRAELLLGAMKDDFRTAVPLYEKAHREFLEQGKENTGLRISYIYALWMSGACETAREMAVNGIGILDELVCQTIPDRLLYQTKRAMLLAIAGQIQEARDQLELLKKEPLCEHCVYCRCKDAEVYSCEVEIVAGEYEKAMQMAEEAAACWKDEEDLLTAKVYAEHRMQKD